MLSSEIPAGKAANSWDSNTGDTAATAGAQGGVQQHSSTSGNAATSQRRVFIQLGDSVNDTGVLMELLCWDALGKELHFHEHTTAVSLCPPHLPSVGIHTQLKDPHLAAPRSKWQKAQQPRRLFSSSTCSTATPTASEQLHKAQHRCRRAPAKSRAPQNGCETLTTNLALLRLFSSSCNSLRSFLQFYHSYLLGIPIRQGNS